MKENAKPYFELLRNLIRVESLSGQEEKTADIIEEFMASRHIETRRIGHNILSYNATFDVNKPTLVLNSHHDTVPVAEGWARDPFGAEVDDGKLYGLGSNDAGGSLVSLIAAFSHFYQQENLPYNLILIASAEEENSGPNGVSQVLRELNLRPDMAIIGEPTGLQMATAEKGLIVIDGIAKGKAGHIARGMGENAIYKAIEDICWIKKYMFPKQSEVLGPIVMNVSMINGGVRHNVTPDVCKFVIDVRVNEHYSNEEIVETLRNHCQSTLTPRSMKWKASGIPLSHPAVQKGLAIGLSYTGSPTLSDQVHFACPSMKIGPGLSERSHTPDEYILLSEIEDGIDTYIRLLDQLKI